MECVALHFKELQYHGSREMRPRLPGVLIKPRYSFSCFIVHKEMVNWEGGGSRVAKSGDLRMYDYMTMNVSS